MPPRYAYWTILVDDQPTAFRAGSQEDLMPTFKRLQAKHGSAKMMWFQNGKLWASRLDAQEYLRMRGERGRSADPKQSGFRARKKLDWRPKSVPSERPTLVWQPRNAERPKLEWRPREEPQGQTQKPQDLKTSRPRRDKNWRPGGEHKDPRQKYRDAKKAKWTRFKNTIRSRWEAKLGKKRDK
jgi:hypothetical protein